MILIGITSQAQIVNLSNSPTRSSVLNAIKCLNNGQIVVVFIEENPIPDIYYNYYNGKSWSGKRKIFADTFLGNCPSLGKGPDGTVHCIFTIGTGGGREVYYGKFNTGRWSGRKKIFSYPDNDAWPRVAYMSNGALQAVWCSRTPGTNNHHWFVQSTWRAGSSWNSSGSRVSDNTWHGGNEEDLAMHPGMCVSGNKTFAVWQEKKNGTATIKFAEKTNNGAWSVPIRISDEGKMANWPMMVADSSGDLHVIYSTISGKVLATHRINGVWLSPYAIHSVGRHSRGFLGFDIDNQNYLHAAYPITESGKRVIYYSGGNTKGGWSTPRKISNGNTDSFPSISADNNGSVHIIWSQGLVEHRIGDILYTKTDAIKYDGSGGGGGGGGGGTPTNKPPIAVFSHNPKLGKRPLMVNFNASASYDPDGSITKYEWDMGDGSFKHVVKMSHNYTRTGKFKPKLTVTDNRGATASYSGEVIVSEPPVAKFTYNPHEGVIPFKVNFNASQSRDPDGRIVHYYWSFGDGSSGSGKTISHVYREDGEFWVILQVEDNYGLSDTQSHKVIAKRISPPLNIRYTAKVNRTLFSAEYLCEITWEKNPENANNGVDVIAYSIYRRIGDGIDRYVSPVKTVKSGTYSWLDRGLTQANSSRYEYTVTSIDAKGNESLIKNLSRSSVTARVEKK
jgi:PKD repeat protein